MNIGIVTEGLAERTALEEIVKELRKAGITILKPIRANVEPKATAKQMAKAAKSAISLLNRKGCKKIIFLIDFEDQKVCIIDKKNELEASLNNLDVGEVSVVIKARQFENWLIADPDAIDKCKNFNITKAFKNRVETNKADSVSKPVTELERIKTNKKSFDKNSDTVAIAKNCNPVTMARNSRSFRRFMYLIDHPMWIDKNGKKADSSKKFPK